MTIQEMLIYIYKKGKSDKYIAKEVGVNQSTISRLRRGVSQRTFDDTAVLIKDLYKRAKKWR